MINYKLLAAATLGCALVPVASAQDSMPGMTMPPGRTSQPLTDQPMADPVSMSQPTNLIQTELQHADSGTSIEPPSTPMAMLMAARPHAGWTLMLHGIASVSDIQQHATHSPTAPSQSLCTALNAVCQPSDRRGGDKLFSTNWIMPMAQRRMGGRGTLTVRAMFSLEPATITGRKYPELFQQGETAYGKPILDGQHPHDFLMELGAVYDLRLAERTLFTFCAAPVGDPAIGPTAYPHRLSASEDPIAALGHHQQDSTHIAFNVVTAGLTQGRFRAEVSGFHGAEPTESRWQPEPSPNGHAVDSVSGRFTYVPTRNLVAQYSLAHITSPEALTTGQDQRRQTASVMYTRAIGAHHDRTSMPGMDMATPATGTWSNTLLWGQTRNLTTGLVENSFLGESLLNFRRRNYAWTRIEFAQRTTELLALPTLTSAPPPELSAGHVQAYTLGYDRDLNHRFSPHLLVAPGAQFTLYRAPDPLVSTYGRTPFSAVVFLRFRIR